MIILRRARPAAFSQQVHRLWLWMKQRHHELPGKWCWGEGLSGWGSAGVRSCGSAAWGDLWPFSPCGAHSAGVSHAWLSTDVGPKSVIMSPAGPCSRQAWGAEWAHRAAPFTGSAGHPPAETLPAGCCSDTLLVITPGRQPHQQKQTGRATPFTSAKQTPTAFTYCTCVASRHRARPPPKLV